jgi:hypothetical protein
MQTYWTDTVAANTNLIAENFGENPEELISYFSNMTQHIGFIGIVLTTNTYYCNLSTYVESARYYHFTKYCALFYICFVSSCLLTSNFVNRSKILLGAILE